MTVKHEKNFIKLDQEYGHDEYDKMINDTQGIKLPTWEKLLKENTKLNLWWAINSGGNVIIYDEIKPRNVPEELTKNRHNLIEKIDWKSVDGRDVATITAQELQALIDGFKENDKQAAKKEKERIEKLAQIAKKTNTSQIVYNYSVECDGSVDSCDIDNIVGYIHPNGSRSEVRHHCY